MDVCMYVRVCMCVYMMLNQTTEEAGMYLFMYVFMYVCMYVCVWMCVNI
jgi:hypothetical protein